MADIKVLKMGGEVVDWNYDKLLASIGKTGLSLTDAEKVADEAQRWAAEESERGFVSSTMLAEKVLLLLREKDEVAAEAYEMYKRPGF